MTEKTLPSRRELAVQIRALVAMSRPSQLGAVTVVYLLGVAIARAYGHELDITTLIWGFAALLPVSASIHYANEYADAETDALTTRTMFSGGSGSISELGISRNLALKAAWGALMVGALIALVGFASGYLGVLFLALLAIGAFFGWMYSLPPLALAWRGWGELDNALLGALLLPLYGYATASGVIDWAAALAIVPFTAIAFVNLLAVTWPDREADAAVGKFTLATRWPIRRLRLLYGLVAVSVYLILFSLPADILPPLVKWSSLLALPFLIWGAVAYTRWRNPFPTVAAMMVLAFVQLGVWWVVGAGL